MLLPPENVQEIHAAAGQAPTQPAALASLAPGHTDTLATHAARRLARTTVLDPLRAAGAHALSVIAPEALLARVAVYAAGAACTYGRTAGTLPQDAQGTMVRQTDPESGALATVACTSRRPLRLSASVEVPGLGVFAWEEAPGGTRLALGCLGCLETPMQLDVTFAGTRGGPLAGYVASVSGCLRVQYAPRLAYWLARTSGTLSAHDSSACAGHIELSTSGDLAGRISSRGGGVALVAGTVVAPVITTAGTIIPFPTRVNASRLAA